MKKMIIKVDREATNVVMRTTFEVLVPASKHKKLKKALENTEFEDASWVEEFLQKCCGGLNFTYYPDEYVEFGDTESCIVFFSEEEN